MFRTKQNWVMVALLAIPAMAQQYPPPQQQQQQYPDPRQGQPYPQQQYPQQQQQYPAYNQPLANYSPAQLDQMVSRIALYPDPLLAQIFAAATFPEQIQDAAQWSDQHHYLAPRGLARAIQTDQFGFDPSIQALLPFPSVLQMMAADMNWTSSLGNAFISEGTLLQDSVQRMRRQAYDNGYLRSNDQVVVNNNGPWMEIQPYNPGYIVVPYYDPAVVYYRPWRPGVRVGISFGYGVAIGSFFNPWGWGGSRFAWDRHEVYINNRVWDRRVIEERRWVDDRRVTGYRPSGGYQPRPDSRIEQPRRESAPRPEPRSELPRGSYEPPRPGPVARPEVGRTQQAPPPPVASAPRPDDHVLRGRDDRERRAAETGRRPVEDHGGDRRREERRH